jgi:hypothetical protein
MSEENVEILRHSFEEAPENPEPFFAMFDENVEWDMSDGPFRSRRRSMDAKAVREFFRTWAGLTSGGSRRRSHRCRVSPQREP